MKLCVTKWSTDLEKKIGELIMPFVIGSARRKDILYVKFMIYNEFYVCINISFSQVDKDTSFWLLVSW